jgi:hypothetical protein
VTLVALWALGAAFGALNVMYAAVSKRSLEIGTLRAIGFGPAPVVVSILVKAMALALGGAVVGSGPGRRKGCARGGSGAHGRRLHHAARIFLSDGTAWSNRNLGR